MKVIPTSHNLKNGVLDLRGLDAELLDVSGLNGVTEIILPNSVRQVNASDCADLVTLIFPQSVEEADITGCVSLKPGYIENGVEKGLVMKGLLRRLTLLDSQKLADRIISACRLPED